MARPLLLESALATVIACLIVRPSSACADFEPPVNYPHFEGVGAITLGDLNGDGFSDLIGTRSPSMPGVYPGWYTRLGLGDGSFGPMQVFANRDLAFGIAMADFDRDGWDDLVSVGFFGKMQLFRSRGDGTFDPPLEYPVSFEGSTVRVGDVNGDAFLDVLAGHRERTIAVFLGDGSGALTRAADAVVTRELAIFALADLDRDGDLDIFTGYSSGFPGYNDLIGQGDGTFVLGTGFLGINPTKQEFVVEAGDLNSDGLLDIVVGHATFDNLSLGVLLATGPGAWGPETIVPTTGGSVISLALADFDLDGRLDIVFVNLDRGDRVRVRLGNGDGTFSPDLDSWKTSIGSEVQHKIAVADLDRNGFPDIVFEDRGPDPFVDPAQVAVVLNRGDRTPPLIEARLEPIAPLPPRPPSSVCLPPTSRAFRVVCAAIDDTDPDPSVTASLRASWRERPTRRAVCDTVIEHIPVACGEVVELHLVPPRCNSRTSRAPRPAVSVNSSGIKVVTAENVVLEIRASDRCGNEATVEVDPTRFPSPLCDEVLEDSTCCPALATPRNSKFGVRPAATVASLQRPARQAVARARHAQR